jgi:hypothetical protein
MIGTGFEHSLGGVATTRMRHEEGSRFTFWGMELWPGSYATEF